MVSYIQSKWYILIAKQKGKAVLGFSFEARSAEHEQTKVAKRPLLESDSSRSDRDRRARYLKTTTKNIH